MQQREVVRLPDQFGVQFQKVVQPAAGLLLVNVAGHDQVGRVVVALAFHQAGVKVGEPGVQIAHPFGQNLELFAAAALDECAHDQMVDDLLVRQEATRRGIAVNPDEVQAELEASIGYYKATLTPFPTNSPEPTAMVSGTAVVLPTTAPREQPTSVSSDSFTYELSKRVQNISSIGYSETDLRGFIETDLLRKKLKEAIGAEVDQTAPHFTFEVVRFNVITDAVRASSDLAAGIVNFSGLISRTNAITEPATIGEGRNVDWISDRQVMNQFGAEVLDLLTYKALNAPTQVVTSTTAGGAYIVRPLGREVRPLAESELAQVQAEKYDAWLTAARADETVVVRLLSPFDLIPSVVSKIAADFQATYAKQQPQ